MRDKTELRAGLPPRGRWVDDRWLSTDEPEPEEPGGEVGVRFVSREELVEPEDLSKQSLTALLETFMGDLAAALQAKKLTEGEGLNQIEVIYDSHMCGDLNDDEFSQLSRLPSLCHLSLRDPRVTDSGLAVLSKMPQLETLGLDGSRSRLTDACFAHIAKLPKLETLSLEWTLVTGAGCADLRSSSTLRDCDFSHSRVDDKGLWHIAGLPALEDLRLWGWMGMPITDEGLKALSHCKRLARLDLMQVEIGDNGIQYLKELPSLEELKLDGTQVSDKSLPVLLAMPKLKSVVFGDNQVSVPAVERLKERGIDVKHGSLLNFRRTNNYLRYAGVDFEVDKQRSGLRAFIEAESEVVTWQIVIECTRSYVPDHMQPAHLEGPPMRLPVGDWRSLVGQAFRESYQDSEVHPILPDNPCNIYVGWHACPNNHVIRFLKRTGNEFLISWKADASESEGPGPGSPLELLAEIPFREVAVWSETGLSVDAARERLRRDFSPDDFEKPFVDKLRFISQIRFPVRATSQ